MINKKEKLINKLVKKDYNSELEEILSNKDFSSEVKNLLLDMLYKIETSYKDYSKVKINVLPESEYIQNIINTININCNSIKFVRPKVKEGENNSSPISVNRTKKEIICYPIITKLLYCLSEIRKLKGVVKTENEVINICLTDLLNTGNCINSVEPLRDFNGFSWDINTREIYKIYHNLIYQDLILLGENNLLEEWVNNTFKMVDYYELLVSDLEEKYGIETAKNIMDIVKKLAVLLEIVSNQEFRKELKIKNKEIFEQLKKLENKEEYIVNICDEKKELIRKVRDIDITINNKDALHEEYRKRNENVPLDKKIFSVRILIQQLEEEREQNLSKIEHCNDLINPKKFIEYRKKIKEYYKYTSLIEIKGVKQEIIKYVTLLQKNILKCFKIKISKIDKMLLNKKSSHNYNEIKKEFIKLVYELRYFSLLPTSKDKKIKDISALENAIEEIEKELIIKGIELKIINPIFKELNTNGEVLKKIFSLKIISLEDINARVVKEQDELFIQFFDEDTLNEKMKIDNFTKKDFKSIKKVKIFV